MIKDYWIEEIKQVKEFDRIGDVEDKEILTLQNAINSLIDDQFIQTATEKGISKREKLLKITPYADDTLESRRFRVAGKWFSSLPYTYLGLLDRLDALCGENGYSINLNHQEYTLNIKVELTVKRMEQDVRSIARTMTPANILVTVELRYRQHKELKKYTHRQLQAYTHRQLREGESLV